MKLPALTILLFFYPAILWADFELPPYSLAYDPARDPFADGRAALELARRTNRRVLIEVGGNWCVWCLKLDEFLQRNAKVREQLYRHFVVLKVNVSEENDNQDFMAGLPKANGYPHMYVTDSTGQVLISKDTVELLEHRRYSQRRFLQFIEKWKVHEQNL